MNYVEHKCLKFSLTSFDFALTALTFIPPLEHNFLLGHELIPMMTVITYYTRTKLAGKRGFIYGLLSLTEGSYPSIFLDYEI